MKHRIVAIFLCICLTLGAFTVAGAEALPLDDLLSRWLDGNERISLSAEFKLNAWNPFPEETLALFNNVLKHMRANVWMETEEDASLTRVQLAMDDSELFQLTEESASESSLRLSLLPNRVLTSGKGSPIDLLVADDQAAVQSFSLLDAITEGQPCYAALMEACAPYTEEKKANYKIKGIGTARYSRVARLTVEQSTGMLEQMRSMLACGMDDAFRERLNGFTFAKGFVVALYQNADHQDLAAYMKGTMIDADGKKYNLAYQWAFINQGVEREDAYKFELKSASRPTDQRIIAATGEQNILSNKLNITVNNKTTLKTTGQTTVDTTALKLSGERSSDHTTLNGTIDQTRKLTVDGDATTSAKGLALDLTLSPKDSSAVLSGTIGYSSKQEKTPVLNLTLTLAEDVPQAFADSVSDQSMYSVTDVPESSLEQSLDVIEQSEYTIGAIPEGLKVYAVPASQTTINLDQADAEARDALLAEVAQALAGKWLLVCTKLPDEDAALLRDGMTDADYATFLSLLNDL